MSDRQDERRPETSLQARREGPTSGKKVWFITGAGRGMGVDIVNLLTRDEVKGAEDRR